MPKKHRVRLLGSIGKAITLERQPRVLIPSTPIPPSQNPIFQWPNLDQLARLDCCDQLIIQRCDPGGAGEEVCVTEPAPVTETLRYARANVGDDNLSTKAALNGTDVGEVYVGPVVQTPTLDGGVYRVSMQRRSWSRETPPATIPALDTFWVTAPVPNASQNVRRYEITGSSRLQVLEQRVGTPNYHSWVLDGVTQPGYLGTVPSSNPLWQNESTDLFFVQTFAGSVKRRLYVPGSGVYMTLFDQFDDDVNGIVRYPGAEGAVPALTPDASIVLGLRDTNTTIEFVGYDDDHVYVFTGPPTSVLSGNATLHKVRRDLSAVVATRSWGNFITFPVNGITLPNEDSLEFSSIMVAGNGSYLLANGSGQGGNDEHSSRAYVLDLDQVFSGVTPTVLGWFNPSGDGGSRAMVSASKLSECEVLFVNPSNSIGASAIAAATFCEIVCTTTPPGPPTRYWECIDPGPLALDLGCYGPVAKVEGATPGEDEWRCYEFEAAGGENSRITIANPAVQEAGNPIWDLREVTQVVAGTPQAITVDAWGRVSESRPLTAGDITALVPPPPPLQITPSMIVAINAPSQGDVLTYWTANFFRWASPSEFGGGGGPIGGAAELNMTSSFELNMLPLPE